MTEPELVKLLGDLQARLLRLKRTPRILVGNTMEIRTLRKNIARVKAVLKEKG